MPLKCSHPYFKAVLPLPPIELSKILSFSKASNRALFFSNGGHGLRHSYAQERMDELKGLGLSRQVALETVSQELGHFRAEITEVYLK